MDSSPVTSGGAQSASFLSIWRLVAIVQLGIAAEDLASAAPCVPCSLTQSAGGRCRADNLGYDIACLVKATRVHPSSRSAAG